MNLGVISAHCLPIPVSQQRTTREPSRASLVCVPTRARDVATRANDRRRVKKTFLFIRDDPTRDRDAGRRARTARGFRNGAYRNRSNGSTTGDRMRGRRSTRPRTRERDGLTTKRSGVNFLIENARRAGRFARVRWATASFHSRVRAFGVVCVLRSVRELRLTLSFVFILIADDRAGVVDGGTGE